MADQSSAKATMEHEAALSWREWPIYVVMRLKRLQDIQQKLRIGGASETAIRRKEEFLEAVHDLSPEQRAEFEARKAEATQASAQTASIEDDDYDADISYDDVPVAVDEGAADADEDYFDDVSFEDV